MKLSFIGFYIGLVALSTVHQLHAQSVDTQAVSDSSKVERIELSIKKAMAAFQVPGVAVAIIKDNEVVLSKGFGVLKHDGSEKVNACLLYTSDAADE